MLLNFHNFRTTERIYPGSTPSKLMLFQWASVGNSFAYVHENNIYYRESAGTSNLQQLTTDGSASIINGHSDWVYEGIRCLNSKLIQLQVVL